MAAKKTRVVLRVSYHGKDGVTPAGESLELPAKEAAELISQGLAAKPGEAAPNTPRAEGTQEITALKAQATKLKAQLAEQQAGFEAKLIEAQNYALALEERLREAGLMDGTDNNAGE